MCSVSPYSTQGYVVLLCEIHDGVLQTCLSQELESKVLGLMGSLSGALS